MTEQLYLDDLEGYELLVFDSNHGFAASTKDKRIIIFKRDGGRWLDIPFDTHEVSAIRTITVTPAEYVAMGGSGMHAAGQSLGVGLKNRQAKSQAAKKTGIRVQTRTLEFPSVFVPYPDIEFREQLVAALGQFINGGPLSGEMKIIPPHVRDQLTRPTARQTERNTGRGQAFHLSPKSGMAMVAFALMCAALTMVGLWMAGVITQRDLDIQALRTEVVYLSGSVIFLGWLVTTYLLTSAVRWMRA